MRRRPSLAAAGSRAAISLGLVAGIAGAGCALLIPPSWRGHAPVPLAGPIEPETLAGNAPTDVSLATLSDEALRARVDADRERLVQLASAPGDGPLAGAPAEAELREIADRLPRLQLELARRARSTAPSRPPPVVR